MARLDKWESKHLKDVERYARQIEAIYQSAVREAAAIGATIPNFNPNKPFSFANYPSTKARIEKLLQTLKTGISTVILNGISQVLQHQRQSLQSVHGTQNRWTEIV